MFVSINPATGETFKEYRRTTDPMLESALEKAKSAFERWRRTSLESRASVLRQFGERIDEAESALAEMITREMGKPITQSLAEVRKSSALCRHSALKIGDYLATETIQLADGIAKVSPEPLGVIFSITPWNFPIWQLVRLAVPAIAAGNSVIVKPSPNTAGSAKLLMEVLGRSDAPSGLYQSVLIDHDQSERLIADDRIAAVGLTGSERAGSHVAATAGRNLKKIVLELGGSDPFIVLADADIGRAAKAAALARFQNAGQVCIAAKRIIVAEAAYNSFVDSFLRETDALKLGDPMREDVYLGPMARADLRAEVDRQVAGAIACRARVLRRGGPLEGAGYFYSPTVLENGAEESPMRRDEVFGPAVLMLSAADEQSAIKQANATRFGLCAALWTRDLDRAQALSSQIDVGCVFVNSVSRSDPAFPLGGVKRSGFGRELGREGAREYTNLKTTLLTDDR